MAEAEAHLNALTGEEELRAAGGLLAMNGSVVKMGMPPLLSLLLRF